MAEFKDYSLSKPKITSRIEPLVEDSGIRVSTKRFGIKHYGCDDLLRKNVTSVLEHVISYYGCFYLLSIVKIYYQHMRGLPRCTESPQNHSLHLQLIFQNVHY